MKSDIARPLPRAGPIPTDGGAVCNRARLIDRPERLAVEARLRGLAQAIHRDPAAMQVMLMRSGDLGIWSGSRLDRVLTAGSEREAMRLSRDRDRGLDLGR